MRTTYPYFLRLDTNGDQQQALETKPNSASNETFQLGSPKRSTVSISSPNEPSVRVIPQQRTWSITMIQPTFIPSTLPTHLHQPRRRVATMCTPPAPDPTRRLLLRTPLLTLLPALSSSESGAIHAELSALASKIPGAGMPDIYYPTFFLGEWLVSRELYAVETGEVMDAPGHTMLSRRAVEMMRERIGKRETFHVRFVSHRGKVIEDRLYNIRAELTQSPERVDVTWDRDNANVLTTQWGVGGRIREVKVTKRSFVDGPQGYGTFVSSEYARVVDLDGEGTLVGFGKPPSVFGRRRIVRYKVSSVTDTMEPDGMDRIVVDYVYPPGEINPRPSVVLKYRDFLNRKHGSEVFVG